MSTHLTASACFIEDGCEHQAIDEPLIVTEDDPGVVNLHIGPASFGPFSKAALVARLAAP